MERPRGFILLVMTVGNAAGGVADRHHEQYKTARPLHAPPIVK